MALANVCSSTPVLILLSCTFPLSSFLPLALLAKLLFSMDCGHPKGPQELSNSTFFLKAGPDSELDPKFWMCLQALWYNDGHRCESRLCLGQTTKNFHSSFPALNSHSSKFIWLCGRILILKELDSKIFKFTPKRFISYFPCWLFHPFLAFWMPIICITFSWCLH